MSANAADARRRARGVQPGSFLGLMLGSRHQGDGRAFSDDETASQAFTFLLAGCAASRKYAACPAAVPDLGCLTTKAASMRRMRNRSTLP